MVLSVMFLVWLGWLLVKILLKVKVIGERFVVFKNGIGIVFLVV